MDHPAGVIAVPRFFYLRLVCRGRQVCRLCGGGAIHRLFHTAAGLAHAGNMEKTVVVGFIHGAAVYRRRVFAVCIKRFHKRVKVSRRPRLRLRRHRPDHGQHDGAGRAGTYRQKRQPAARNGPVHIASAGAGYPVPGAVPGVLSGSVFNLDNRIPGALDRGIFIIRYHLRADINPAQNRRPIWLAEMTDLFSTASPPRPGPVTAPR